MSLKDEFDGLCKRRRNGEISADEYVQELNRIAEDAARLLEEQGQLLEAAQRAVEEAVAA